MQPRVYCVNPSTTTRVLGLSSCATTLREQGFISINRVRSERRFHSLGVSNPFWRSMSFYEFAITHGFREGCLGDCIGCTSVRATRVYGTSRPLESSPGFCTQETEQRQQP